MGVHSLCQSFLFLSLIFFGAVNLCSADDKTFEVVGTTECADCSQNNFKTSQAFSGLHVTIDCKLENGDVKRFGAGEVDEQGKFKVALSQKLNDKCYAQLHSAAALPCPAHNGIEASKIVLKSQTNNGKTTFAPAKTLQFSATLCSSKTFLPYWKHPPLPPHPWFKPLPKPTLPPYTHPWFHKPTPSPVPVYTPAPKPPVVEPLPPPVPVYTPTPKPPVVEPLPPPVPTPTPKPPIYKPKPKPPAAPKPPVYKPTPKPPVYKPTPKPPVYKPTPKPPVYKPTPKPPVYKPTPKPPVVVKPPVKKPCPPTVVKPLPPPVPVYKPPVKKPCPPVVVKPLPPPVPVYKPPVKKPCPPVVVKPLPPLPKIPPKYFHHPKFGHYPPLPPHHP